MAKKILVIDDSALMRRVISDIINEGNDYEVAAIAKDGLEGFDMIVSNPNLYSAIILDINMPKMNGLELLQKLQKNHIEQTVIVVSTVAKEGAKETIQALEYGAFDFVTKPENSRLRVMILKGVFMICLILQQVQELQWKEQNRRSAE